ncbi:hypothetical protein K3H35_18845 [Aeromonas veronii]|uniref:hypothetical protein n=1 Tax=Aeromonas veronii TaxID=654 RepID=UPI001F34CBDA|nr:hypothetical protein [Aeromonas veronii]MCF5910833.1 hypothetical protein [Aeromonas veronii]
MENISKHVVYNYFTDNSDITVSPVLMNKLISEFSQYEIYPNVSSEFNVANGDRKSFIRLFSPDEKIQVNMQSFFTNIIVNVSENKFFKTELEAIQLIISKLNSVFPGKLATRLAYLTCHVYHGNEDEYNNVYKNAANREPASAIYPIEWEFRNVYRESVDNPLEKLNVISNIKRGGFTTPFVVQAPTNGFVLLETDVNTVFDNQTARYSYAQAHELLTTLYDKSEQSVASIKSFI